MEIKRMKKLNNRVPIMTAEDAVAMIPDDAVIYMGGDGLGRLEPAKVLRALADKYHLDGHPTGLTLIHPTGLGDRLPDSDRGYGVVAIPGMVKRLLSGHVGQAAKLMDIIQNNEVEAYNFSMGTLSQMMRAAAAHQPGVLTKTGLGTFLDPRQKGGKLNPRTTEDLVSLVEIGGEEYLFYKTVRPNVTILRGTTADTEGYITVEEEVGAKYLDDLSSAQAAHNNGGLVIVQVKRIVEAGSLRPYDVRIPGILVDAVVVDPEQAQTYANEGHQPDFFATGDLRSTAEIATYDLTERKVIARRALMEGRPGDVGNVGVGVMTALNGISNEEGINNEFTLTFETGSVGGISGPSKNKSHAASSVNMKAIVPMADMFNFYEGGGLDIAFLSFAQVDRYGNVNVHLLNGKIMGTGGFVHITSNAKRLVFGGTMTAGGYRASVGNGKLEILQEGKFLKFVDDVDQITFNGTDAIRRGQQVLFVTERCVLELHPEGIILTEIAPGMTPEADVLPFMTFKPQVSKNLKEMDRRLFCEEKMNIKDEWCHK